MTHKYAAMNVDYKKLVSYWITASEKDLHAAKEIFVNTKNYVSVLFYIHLFIEKALKAYYVQKKKTHAPFSHNLLFLSKEVGIEIDKKHNKLMAEINEFNIECRYPDEKFGIYKKATKSFTMKYLTKAEELHAWILGQLKQM
jgi:HEPN domain-containing protein